MSTRAPLSSSKRVSSSSELPGSTGTPTPARPGDGEQALDHLDTVAEQYSHSVTAPQAEPSQVTGQPCGPPFQLPLGHTPEPVLETDLVPEATGVVPEQFRQRFDDVGMRTHCMNLLETTRR